MKSCPTCRAAYPTNFAVCPQDGATLVDAATWPEGMVVRGKYRILSKIGQGGMGAVYKALHITFDELRALKVISPELLGDELFVRRFKHEAVITRKLQHPNAVRVDDIDEAEDGRPFIVMEFIEGQSLKKLIHEVGALPVPRVCSIVKQVAAALDAAHGLGMVHRDIKPDNVVLVQTPAGEQAKVLDFGIAKIKEGRAGATAGMTLTGTGVVIGTPQYMSPEQAMGKRGDQLDGRSDLYSLGVVMYEMLTGDLPFKADTSMEMLLAHLQRAPTPIRTLRPELQIPEPVAALVMKLLEKSRDMRPPGGAALIAEINEAEGGIPAAAATRVARSGSGYVPGAAEALQAALRANSRSASGGAVAPGVPPPVAPVVQPPSAPAGQLVPGVVPAAERVAALPQAKKPRWVWLLWGIVVLGFLSLGAVQHLDALEWLVVGTALLILGAGAWHLSARAQPSAWTLGLWILLTSAVGGVCGLGWYEAVRRPTIAPESSIPTSLPSTPAAGGQAEGSAPTSDTGSQPSRQEETARPATETRPAASPAVEKPSVSEAAPVPAKPAPRTRGTPPRREAQPPKPAVDAKEVAAAIKMGDFFFNRGEYDNAITEYQRGLGLDPGNRELTGRVERARRAKAAEERLNQ